MADLKISQMTKATVLSGEELVPIVQNGANKSADIELIRKDLATETWVQDQINETHKVLVVQTLPAEGLLNRIYLVPNDATRPNDIYDEYIWLGPTNKWEFLGNKQVTIDLSAYYTKTDADDKFVQKEANKGLSTNDYTATDKAEVAKITDKVDKIAGKGLSANDFTDVLKTKLDGLSNYNDTAVTTSISEEVTRATAAEGELNTKIDTKVDKVAGKQLSTEDYTTSEKEKLASLANYDDTTVKSDVSTNTAAIEAEVARAKAAETALGGRIDNKVDKIDGKQLSTNDYTTAEKTKLDGVATGANNYVHPTTAGNKHIPSGGSTGQILINSGDGTAVWQDAPVTYDNLEAMCSYGVEWDITVADPSLTRIGNPLLHKSLPIQSAYRGCVVKGVELQYWLNPSDWSQKEDGTPSVLDGTDGTVRVHTPKFYGKSGSDGNKRWVKISMVQCDGTWEEIPEMYIDAYRCTVDTTVSATPKAVSVVNTTAQFRGGGNRAANDTYLDTDKFRSDLCKPRTNVSRATMRTYATNAGSELLCYEYYKWIFYWAWVIEYATFNSQAAYNANLTSDGYRQGGLGAGVTTMDGTHWSEYNGYYPLTPCGFGNDIGNFTGVKTYEVAATTNRGAQTMSMPRWRGFDNPFGDIWTNLDGIVLKRPAASQPSNVYTTTNMTHFDDSMDNKSIAGVEIPSDGYTKAYDLGEKAEIIPSAVGGSTTTYMCDYHYCNAGSTEVRTLIVGGYAANGATAGLGYFYSFDGVGLSSTLVGFRTLNRV